MRACHQDIYWHDFADTAGAAGQPAGLAYQEGRTAMREIFISALETLVSRRDPE